MDTITTEISIPYTGHSSDGIFAWMTQHQGKNPLDLGIVDFNIPVRPDPFMRKSAILGQHKKQSFYNYAAGFPKCRENWVEFDFRNLRVQISAYLISTCDRYVMKSWDIIGSNDHQTWVVIDSVRNATLMKNADDCIFLCRRLTLPFRYIRYVQHGNWERDEKCRYFIQVGKMDFFGIVGDATG
jgi:hypothetical protein